jgi:Nucleotidyl transferase of unknown function (DUF2204)
MVLDENFKAFIELLNANDVKYLVIGGYAVAYHGYPRYTKDIDFWIWANPENAENVLKVLQKFGFGGLGLQKEDLLNVENIIQLGYEPNRIDLLMELKGLNFETCYAHCETAEFEGVPIRFLNLDDLIQNKLSTGRLKDKVDAQTLVKKSKKFKRKK